MNRLAVFVLLFNSIYSTHSEFQDNENITERILQDKSLEQNNLHKNVCTANSGKTITEGICVPIRRCDILYNLMGEVQRRPDLKVFLRSLRCDNNKTSPHVCCPYPSVNKNIVQDTFPYFLSPPNCGMIPKTETRILGGDTTQIGAWPWMAALGYRTFESSKTLWLCGGTLISKQHILSAAHCLKPKHPEYILTKVRLGGNDLTNYSDGVEISIDKITTHPNYTFTKSNHDIGIIKLKSPVDNYGNIQPICLPKSTDLQNESFMGHNPFVLGWGITNVDTGGRSLTKLIQAQIPIVDNVFCNISYAKKGKTITNEQICAYDANNKKDTCQGDSGGPLMVPFGNAYHIIGIVSFGYKCGEPGYPGVNTRVTSYLKWISSVMD